MHHYFWEELCTIFLVNKLCIILGSLFEPPVLGIFYLRFDPNAIGPHFQTHHKPRKDSVKPFDRLLFHIRPNNNRSDIKTYHVKK